MVPLRLQLNGERISEKIFGYYMCQMGIKAQWVKPYIQTTIAPDFSPKLKNILDEKFNPGHPDTVCVPISYTSGQGKGLYTLQVGAYEKILLNLFCFFFLSVPNMQLIMIQNNV